MPITSRSMTIAFRDQQGYGWSETWWYAGGTDAATVLFNAQQLITQRSYILCQEATMTHVRIQSSVKRDPFIFTPGFGAGTPGTLAAPMAPSEVRLKIRYASNVLGYARHLHGGIPLNVVDGDSYVPGTPLDVNLGNWFIYITSGLWHAVGTLNSPPTRYPISLITPTPPRGFQFSCPTLPGTVNVGDQVRVHATSVPGYSGIKTITLLAGGAGNVVVVGGAAPAAADTSPAAYITLISTYDAAFTYPPIIEGITRRGAGRPFGLTRGRRQTLYPLRR